MVRRAGLGLIGAARTLVVAVAASGAVAGGPTPVAAPLPPPPVLAPSVGSCPVTQPNGGWPPGRAVPEPQGTKTGGFGNDALWTNLWMWAEESRVPVPSSHVLPDGSFGPMKWAWYRFASGHLDVTGRRLDAAAPPLRVDFPGDYGESGFQPVGLIFPTGGCWEVTGRVGEARLTFVTLIVPPASVGPPGGSSVNKGG